MNCANVFLLPVLSLIPPSGDTELTPPTVGSGLCDFPEPGDLSTGLPLMNTVLQTGGQPRGLLQHLFCSKEEEKEGLGRDTLLRLLKRTPSAAYIREN